MGVWGLPSPLVLYLAITARIWYANANTRQTLKRTPRKVQTICLRNIQSNLFGSCNKLVWVCWNGTSHGIPYSHPKVDHWSIEIHLFHGHHTLLIRGDRDLHEKSNKNKPQQTVNPLFWPRNALTPKKNLTKIKKTTPKNHIQDVWQQKINQLTKKSSRNWPGPRLFSTRNVVSSPPQVMIRPSSRMARKAWDGKLEGP